MAFDNHAVNTYKQGLLFPIFSTTNTLFIPTIDTPYPQRKKGRINACRSERARYSSVLALVFL